MVFKFLADFLDFILSLPYGRVLLGVLGVSIIAFFHGIIIGIAYTILFPRKT